MNCTMPALVSNNDGSSGMSDDEGQRLQPFSSKKLRYFSRISALVMYFIVVSFYLLGGRLARPAAPLTTCARTPPRAQANKARSTLLTMLRLLIGLGLALLDALERRRDVGMRRRGIGDGIERAVRGGGALEEHAVCAYQLPPHALFEIIHETDFATRRREWKPTYPQASP